MHGNGGNGGGLATCPWTLKPHDAHGHHGQGSSRLVAYTQINITCILCGIS